MMERHTKRFGTQDQQAFAALSGDRNPLHLDPVASRRTQMGAPVVHGIHLLAWALDTVLSSRPADLTHVEIAFHKPVYVGEEVVLTTAARDGGIDLALVVDSTTVAIGAIGIGAVDATRGIDRRDLVDAAPLDWPGTPTDLQLGDMSGLCGRLPLGGAAGAARAFPSLSRQAGIERMAGLLTVSRLVGMRCPGLHSILATVDLVFAPLDASRSLAFRVVDVDDRFRKVRMAVESDGLHGRVDAFARQPPTAQPSMQEVARHVRPDAFAGAKALVVGGSRGLGEVTAKLLAAGGATPVITYAVGRTDAERVAAEIEASGRACTVRRLDITTDVADQLAAWPDVSETMYYFATGFIARRHARSFDAATFSEFVRFYVTGFHDLVEAMMQRNSGSLGAFYPSSVLVAERARNFTEYAMAKAAGEVLCADLDRATKGLAIVVRRLPRLLTDQTATVYPAKMEPTLATMAEVVAATQGGVR